ncbi:formate-dependent phosphoribosylglycinamide formyltransferase [Mycobacterium timonense]|uniref:Formate-dependent phosphoribosylglycinamide formyltransferase n=3 Tax=Mycobacterium avium complex (MAC) TaxID=120793 RepID=A0AAW5SBN5_MYCBC|nr:MULTISPECIES: formate-dependent phosphoribosylglycinamide formyltransferase [Mycobacterium avium complex (MAC)]MBZ4632013.1 formate-dependent phosphoribosylglycinamide formyltransferase [Mycobacterium avium subsp. hominissuis]MCV6992816.1 formate-dependent phosphoribosylglycinamide formyltransferase [Mycobacterium bouchedurhonense]MCV6993299.1 formate-dependent phosphoribosylglycinamide formyltransferase [Mycobacterium timonense]MDV3306488.1 formate-dependent phosphoribosylglycinamide formyl
MRDEKGETVAERVTNDEWIDTHRQPPAHHARDGYQSQPGNERRTRWTRVMLLGAGEFSPELATAFQRLGAEVIAVEPDANGLTQGITDQSQVLDITDTNEMAAVIGRLQPNYVVTATDMVTIDALTLAAETDFAQVFPTARSLRLTADREGLRRLAADQLGLPTVPFWFAGSLDELRAVADDVGYPLRVQPLALVASAGRSVILGPQDIETAWQRAISAAGAPTPNRVLAETSAAMDFHVTLLAVCTDGPDGPTTDFCAPIGHDDPIGDVQEFWQPQEMSPAALELAKSIAARVVKALGGRGIFGVELMVRGDEVYFSDVSAQPYERTLVTLRTQRLSAFELQARAVLGLTTDTTLVSPGAARVIYGRDHSLGPAAPRPESGHALADALAVPQSEVWLRAQHQLDHHRRRFGMAITTAADVWIARDQAAEVSAALSNLF